MIEDSEHLHAEREGERVDKGGGKRDGVGSSQPRFVRRFPGIISWFFW
jgi:hypothetical protein